MMKLKTIDPAGHRVLIKPDEIEKVSEGGIIIEAIDNARKKEAQQLGTVVKVGPTAWRDFSDGTPWAKAGDRVLFVKYAGFSIDLVDGLHRVVNDEDITAVVTE